jgi:SAM-dependent methyltransferase
MSRRWPRPTRRLCCEDGSVRTFDDLVAEAERADVAGWDFSWLDGRASEERPPWGYARLVATRLPTVSSALDIDTGGGEVLAEMAAFPPLMCATEGWPPNVAKARALLAPLGVDVVHVDVDGRLPFPDATFELVTSRHPVRPDWPEIHRVLGPGGRYLAQHVGPASAFELIEYFLGPLPGHRSARDPRFAVRAAEQVGLSVTDLRTARLRMEFFDIGAVVYMVRKCVWWVPDFSVDRYLDKLRALDTLIRAEGVFVAHSTRYLIEATR